MSYTILFKETAHKELYALPTKILNKVVSTINDLSKNPRPIGVKS
jgi:mRNA-degrading endonuclease RelE of RelBE toxin-antitoxin system